jgi:hypothetical protein
MYEQGAHDHRDRGHLRSGDHEPLPGATKTEAVDLALRHLAGQPMTREEALTMRGANAIVEPPVEAPPYGAA